MPRLLLVIGAFALIACGSEPESWLAAGDEQSRPLFAVLGGNRTCGAYAGESRSPYAMALFREFDTVKRELLEQHGVESRYVISCYTDADPTIYYVTSDNPEYIHSSKDQKVVARTVEQMHVQESGSVFVFGYSYGGWLTMITAAELAKTMSLAAIATIDPISRVECTYTRPFGCTRAPQDIRKAERELISSSTGWWSNFYQTQTFYLQSSAIREADLNARISRTHFTIDTSRTVWSNIKGLVDQYRL